jgi:hypothetical protein
LERGFVQESAMPTYRVFVHPGAKLPSVLLREKTARHPLGIALKVDSIGDFLLARGREGCIEGSPLSPFRRCLVQQEEGVALLAVERRGTRSMEPFYSPENYADEYLAFKERWQARGRYSEDEEEAIKRAILIAEEMVSHIGKDTASWVVLECERAYWQRRNLAAQIQKNRQDRLGLGWGNHDHHTFRSSRKNFSLLVRLFETLGFHCRERYHAGEQAGWGAQIMENSIAGLILFLDVDLSAEEIQEDFAHHPLPDKNKLGTVGLWCALHGDSILQAGMHHLEAQFDFERLTKDLAENGVAMMEPFSHFPYLKQAFTKGEQWKVSSKRVEVLRSKGQITQEQAARFLKEGALGSHLENLQRNEGYKGFNKDSVNIIIKKTDPRL